ncbi:hypothetical protein, partial [Stenotrophomonas maltophilia]|uniref:hypothetical protein n=1 Tax=Stenotrophomonas maltophilia TaxID=40324 RepID=UPI0031451965
VLQIAQLAFSGVGGLGNQSRQQRLGGELRCHFYQLADQGRLLTADAVQQAAKAAIAMGIVGCDQQLNQA